MAWNTAKEIENWIEEGTPRNTSNNGYINYRKNLYFFIDAIKKTDEYKNRETVISQLNIKKNAIFTGDIRLLMGSIFQKEHDELKSNFFEYVNKQAEDGSTRNYPIQVSLDIKILEEITIPDGLSLQKELPTLYLENIQNAFEKCIKSEKKICGNTNQINTKIIIKRLIDEQICPLKCIGRLAYADALKVYDDLINPYILGVNDYEKKFNEIDKFKEEFITETTEKSRYETQEISKEISLENKLAILKSRKQIIMQGPPGTGKTRVAKQIANMIVNRTEDTESDEKYKDQIKLIQFHPAYSYEDFVRGIVAKSENDKITYQVENKILAEMAENAEADKNNAYVLIIDEINRANLSAVLGELIYALEYRDQSVESLYAINGDRTITLPSNLYIIGTMNTADRSVGNMDYALRRRFAFIDVLPDSSVISNAKALARFEVIDELFKEKISPEFDAKDVQLGHSYFLGKDPDELEEKYLYQVLPILNEYIKDGVLINITIDQIQDILNDPDDSE